MVELPMPEGDRYEAVVPDTLDLADHARLAMNGIGGTLDPDMGFLPFHFVHWSSKTPHLQHCASADLGCGAKLCESFPLMRIMSGNREYRCGSNLLWMAKNPSEKAADGCVPD